MKNFKVLQFLCTIEKMLNIHRNFIFMSKGKIFFTSLIIFCDVITTTLIFIDNINLLTALFGFSFILLASALTFHAMYAMHNLLVTLYFGPGFGSEFKKLLSSLSSCHEIVKYHPPYLKHLIKIKINCVVACIGYAVLRVIVCSGLLGATVLYSEYNKIGNVHHIFYYVFKTCAEARFVLGPLMYYSLLEILRSMLQSVTALLRASSDAGSLKDTVNNSTTVYQELLESNRQLKACFGHQILFAISLAATHFVVVMYRTVSFSLTKGDIYFITRINAVYHILLYGTMIIVIAKSSQEVSNEVTKLRRLLAQVLSKSSVDYEAACHRNLKDFHRLVSVQPLAVELPALPVGMYLLPAVLSLTVNYTIVGLQMHEDI